MSFWSAVVKIQAFLHVMLCLILPNPEKDATSLLLNLRRLFPSKHGVTSQKNSISHFAGNILPIVKGSQTLTSLHCWIPSPQCLAKYQTSFHSLSHFSAPEKLGQLCRPSPRTRTPVTENPPYIINGKQRSIRARDASPQLIHYAEQDGFCIHKTQTGSPEFYYSYPTSH